MKTLQSFGANDDYRKTMSQKRFRQIRGNLVVSPPQRTDEKTNIPATYLKRSSLLWKIYF